MSSTQGTTPRWPTTITRLGTISGLIALFVLTVAGPGYRLGVLPLQPALLGAALGFLLLVIALLVGGIGLLAGRIRSLDTSRTAIAIVLVAGVATVLAAFWFTRLRSAPPIHDITTDLEDAPAFVDLVSVRESAGAVNPVDYRRSRRVRGRDIDVSDAQRRAYPDIQPVVLSQPPAQALEAAERAAQAMGWQVVAVVRSVVPGGGRIEATDSTLYFGFKDDVVIRVLPDPRGSRVDVRSVSRVGVSDLGTNARRIRAYTEELRRTQR